MMSDDYVLKEDVLRILREHNITGPILQIIEDMSSTLNTDTHKHTYLVAQLCGGIQEDPEQYYRNYCVIKATDEKSARDKYNDLYSCNYYYGHIVCEMDSSIPEGPYHWNKGTNEWERI